MNGEEEILELSVPASRRLLETVERLLELEYDILSWDLASVDFRWLDVYSLVRNTIHKCPYSIHLNDLIIFSGTDCEAGT